MTFRRHIFNSERAIARAATPADLTSVSQLLVTARHFLINYAGQDLSELIGHTPGALITADQFVWAAAIAGYAHAKSAWLRTLVFADGLKINQGLSLLMPALHEQARAAGVQQIYYGGDAVSDIWLAPHLITYGYVHETHVITYEKGRMRVPASGNQDVVVRPVQVSDLDTILAIDQACFELHWAKDQPALRLALQESPLFLIAELGQKPIGYTFVMDYYEGRQLHLVRIAVLPNMRSQGIGVRLLADVVDFARNARAELLTLNTQEYNTPARRLYEWFGFRQTGERQLILRADLDPKNK
ncbi:MAG: GNAT family N-acetyltransferase [Roseiflexaceae bacterium]|nr:GNAT family N-acetyltransferase [Roseiflexaceae bacterium]